ncbi:MAG: chloride channel protein [Chloroflexi bacterium]|nr:chloride channel protein [Chloroflexota bacterium]MCC6896736.1 chloride channel protein [Anaerolineae bacterium]
MSFMSEGRQTGASLLKLSILAALIGAIGGVTAELLHRLIGFVTNLAFYQRVGTEIVSPLESPLGAGIILIPALGGLLIGLMARYGSPLVRGHGIPEAMEAVLTKSSRIPPKVALLKPISAAISIGSGQPFGAEGPIIQTGAAIGSILGQALHTTAAERKVLLACGAAAGLAATFGTPLAAIIFAIELLLFEFRARSFIPLTIASSIATGIHIVLFGAGPVFLVGTADFGSPINLMFFLALGVLCGLLATGLTRMLYIIEDGFHRLKVNTYLWPALGGLFVGVVGYIVPMYIYPNVDVFGPGYEVIGGILNNHFAIGFLLVLLFSKAAVWLVSLGSGTSGGVLAPVFMIGAAFGAIFGLVMKQLFPGMDAAPVAFAMAGMAAVFGSSTRATFASIVFAFEMTQNYHAILPVMLASVIADAVVNALMTSSILTEQLQRKGVLVHHEYEADVLDMIPVRSVMTKDVVTVPQTMTVGQLIERINLHDPRLTRHQALLIVDEQEHLKGLITRHDLLAAARVEGLDNTVLEAGSTDLIVAYPDETVRQALIRMMHSNIGRLPVVNQQEPTKIVGYLSRSNIMSAYLQRVREEAHVEKGWLPYLSRKSRGSS